ncbi:MAG: hypothetical protein JO227_13995, partial [Acetobacteraceae bacterium]|nr:hypothetical protein [Acetobacteraceae bacterium]
PVRVLDPATEALLLVVRAILDLSRLDPVLSRQRSRVAEKFALDREKLAAQVDRDMMRASAARFVSDELAEMFAQAWHDPRPLERQSRLRRRLRQEIALHRKYNGIESRVRSVGRSCAWLFGGLNEHVLRLARPWRRRTLGGGVVVAVLGVDGSGKSSVTRAIRQWLGAEIDVLPMYFGTGDGRPSLLLLPFKLLVPFVTSMIGGSKPKGSSHGKVSDRPPGLLYSVLMAIWATALACEKRLKVSAARRAANRGMLVLGDRYPQDEIRGFNDGPLLPNLRGVPKFLRRFEAEAYAVARRGPPELIIKLKATPETLAIREPNMKPPVIRQRVADLDRLRFPGSTLVAIDAEQPLEEVIRAVKREIWRLL